MFAGDDTWRPRASISPTANVTGSTEDGRATARHDGTPSWNDAWNAACNGNGKRRTTTTNGYAWTTTWNDERRTAGTTEALLG